MTNAQRLSIPIRTRAVFALKNIAVRCRRRELSYSAVAPYKTQAAKLGALASARVSKGQRNLCARVSVRQVYKAVCKKVPFFLAAAEEFKSSVFEGEDACAIFIPSRLEVVISLEPVF